MTAISSKPQTTSELALAHAEIRDLQRTIQALRTELEQKQADREIAVQAAVAASSHEMLQLKETAGALREALEMARADCATAVQ